MSLKQKCVIKTSACDILKASKSIDQRKISEQNKQKTLGNPGDVVCVSFEYLNMERDLRFKSVTLTPKV